jgi:hypothetical protein
VFVSKLVVRCSLGNSEKHVKLSHELKSGELVASWTVGIGDQDQVLHLWKYTGGYGGVDAARLALEKNAVGYYYIYTTILRNAKLGT